jgi:hypothetical protein
MKNEQKFIIECIRAFLGSYDAERLKILYRLTNKKRLNALIGHQNLEGFFYHLYLHNFFNPITLPTDLIQRLKEVSGKNLLANTINDRETLKIVNQLADKNLDYICMKGLSTRSRCYNNDYIKRSTDIDLFIKKGDYGKVKDILLVNGYEIPHNHYTHDFDVRIPFEEYEKRAYEISFVSKENALKSVIDLQWGFTRAPLFRELYTIDSLYQFDSTDEIEVEGGRLRVFPLEVAFINMSFHYAFGHGFKGLQWLVEICLFIIKYETKMDFGFIHETADVNLKKILGIILMLAYELNATATMSRRQKKVFCLDRLLPFEYCLYKRMALKPKSSALYIVSLNLIKILLPYTMNDRLRVMKYLFFNTDSIRHRVDPGKKTMNLLLPFLLLKLLIFDVMRIKKRNK